MLLTIKTTHKPAIDFGFLLHKNPKRSHRFSLGFGEAYIFFPVANESECMMTLLLDIDPITAVKKQHESFTLGQYVNDRSFAASSFLSVAIGKTLRSAMNGICTERPDLLKTAIPLEACIGVLPAKGKNGKELLLSLFQPLGYCVEVKDQPLDEKYPEWGHSHYYQVTLTKTCLLKELLSHLYVLIPVLDNSKHYWVSNDEVDKLLRAGEGWLNEHPARDIIVTRYLKKQRSLTHQALDRLLEQTGIQEEDEEEEEKTTLQKQRMQAVVDILKKNNVRSIADLGCGDGDLLQMVWPDLFFENILGMDVSYRELERAKNRLRWEHLPKHQQKRLTLIQGSLNYTDKRLLGYEAVTLVEVIEHFDVSRLPTLEYVVFGFIAPRVVVITTPNADYNKCFDTLPKGQFRHTDHRFEWTRQEFQTWAQKIATSYGYVASFHSVGNEDKDVGSPTQMGLFIKNGSDKKTGNVEDT